MTEDISHYIDAVHVVDLLKEGGLDMIVKETGDLKFGFATKAQSLITGWERGLIPDRVIHLDVDIAIVRSTPIFNLGYAIEPLEVNSICAMPYTFLFCLQIVYACYSITTLPESWKGTPLL